MALPTLTTEKSEETQKAKLKHLLNTELTLTQKWSLTDKTILKANLSDLSDLFNLKAYSTMIALICAKIGCKLPSLELSDFLTQHHIKYFSDFNINEVNLAFEMYILGDIKDEKGEVPQHFQNFDCMFYSKVLSIYKVKRDKVVLSAKNLQMKYDIDKSQELTPEKERNANLGLLNQILASFEDTTIMRTSTYYDVLDELKLIEITREHKREYMEKAKQVIKGEALQRGEMRTIREVANNIYSEIELKAISKRLAYIDFLSKPENKTKVENKIKQLFHAEN